MTKRSSRWRKHTELKALRCSEKRQGLRLKRREDQPWARSLADPDARRGPTVERGLKQRENFLSASKKVLTNTGPRSAV